MRVEDGKIVEITESELFALYIDRGMDDLMDFHEYKRNFERGGCIVTIGDSE